MHMDHFITSGVQWGHWGSIGLHSLLIFIFISKGKYMANYKYSDAKCIDSSRAQVRDSHGGELLFCTCDRALFDALFRWTLEDLYCSTEVYLGPAIQTRTWMCFLIAVFGPCQLQDMSARSVHPARGVDVDVGFIYCCQQHMWDGVYEFPLYYRYSSCCSL